jgi:hypothetical protein
MQENQIILKLFFKRNDNMKFLLICPMIFALNCFSCSFDTLLIVKRPEFVSCADYFKVSPKLEPDSSMRKVLQLYLYRSLVGVRTCSIDSVLEEKLYVRKSFGKMILLFYTDSSYEKLSHFEYVSQWRDGYDNLLRNCMNKKVIYKIINNLLELNISNGLTVIWDKVETERLPYFKTYMDRVIKNKLKYKCSELAVIFHNLGRYSDRDKMLTTLQKDSTSNSIALILKNSFNSSGKISYEDYIERIFGGH